MSAVQKAREALSGYVQVFGPHNHSVFEMPNPHLIRLLTSRKREKGQRLVSEFMKEAEKTAQFVADMVSESAPDERLIRIVIEEELKLLKPEFQKIVSSGQETLRHAASLGITLGLLDRNEIGANLPVALATHKRAVQVICEKYFPETDAPESDVLNVTAQCIARSAFYIVRKVPLIGI